MSSSGRRREKRGKGDDHNEGTAARTRPPHSDEIINRRKHKIQSECSRKYARKDRDLSGDVVVEKFSEYNESERNHSYQQNTFCVAEKHLTNEFVKVSSRKKEDCTHAKSGSSARHKDKERRQSDSKYMDEGTRISKHRKNRESEIRSTDGSLSKEKDRENYESETIYKDDRLSHSKHRGSLMSEIRLKDGSLPKQRDRGSGGPDTHLKDEMKKEVLSKSEFKSHKRISSHVVIYERSNGDSDDKTTRKYSRDLTMKDRLAERSGQKSEKESKRKSRIEDDEKDRGKSSARKHDLGRGRDIEISERRDRKESPKPHYGEPKLKRRRSRSREREDRSRRSISRSPGPPKHTSYHGREHEEMNSQSVRDRSKRQHSDIDRSKVTSNGSSSHHRRHGGSMSGLGGYSPRKRKTEAAVKTPSPINRSPERKGANWDIAPGIANYYSSGSVPSTYQMSNQTMSSKADEVVRTLPDSLTASKPLTEVSVTAFLAKQNVPNDTVQLTQATRPMRSLILENVPASASEKAVMEFLNNFLLSSGVNKFQGSLPCINCIIHKDKGQAVMEFLTPEDAAAALSCDGISFSGSVLKVRRPRDFVQVANGEKEKSVTAVNSVSDVVNDSPHKIFVGGISKAISSKMFMEIASTFGSLKAYHFEVNKDHDRPCAFMEYVDQAVTSRACAGLNGMKLGRHILTAVQTVPNASFLENSGNPPFYGIPEHAVPLLEKPTQVIKLKNVFNPEGVSSLTEPELEEVLEDVRLECARFGTIKSVNVAKGMDSCIPTSHACEALENTAATVGQNIESEETDKKEESPEVIGRQSTEVIGSESPTAKVGVHCVKEDEEINDNKPADTVLEDQPLPEEVDNDMAVKDQSRESSSGPSLKDECQDVHIACKNQIQDIDQENKLSAEEEIKGDEANRNLVEASAATKEGITELQSDATENVIKNVESKEHDNNIGDMFETGCIFVEFRRTEAACMAAHCLHGRPFDDRVVSVEYVPLDLYKARFPK